MHLHSYHVLTLLLFLGVWESIHKSVYRAQKGGNWTIKESIKGHSHYLEGNVVVGEGNTFRT